MICSCRQQGVMADDESLADQASPAHGPGAFRCEPASAGGNGPPDPGPPRPAVPGDPQRHPRDAPGRLPDPQPAHPRRQRHGFGGHGDVRGQPHRAGRQDARLHRRRLRHANEGRRRTLRRRRHRHRGPLGTGLHREQVADAIREHGPFKVVGIVHAETSTGAAQPIEPISQTRPRGRRLLLVDTVTSLAGMAVDVDGWRIDACYSGTQKCLSCPPGLSPVTFSAAAEQAIASRKTKVRAGTWT